MTDRNFTLDGSNVPIHWDHVEFVLQTFAAELKPKAKARALARVYERADGYVRNHGPNVVPMGGTIRDQSEAAYALRVLVEEVAP